MALSAQYIIVKIMNDISGLTEVIAESTSVDAQFSAEAMEATSQTNGLTAVFEAGKNKITVSGDYLSASTGATFDDLFARQNAGSKFEIEIYRDTTKVLATEGVFTSLNQSGALSDSLATGAYSIECDSTALDGGYGPELHVSANAASDPNGNEADATTGWDSFDLAGTGSNVFESQSSVKSNGSYALHGNSNDTPTNACRFELSLTLEEDETYRITFKIRHVGVGGSWDAILVNAAGNTVMASIAATDLTFVEYTHNTITTGGSWIKLRFQENNVGYSGGLYVDNVSVMKVL